jgi:hypothetical protein
VSGRGGGKEWDMLVTTEVVSIGNVHHAAPMKYACHKWRLTVHLNLVLISTSLMLDNRCGLHAVDPPVPIGGMVLLKAYVPS